MDNKFMEMLAEVTQAFHENSMAALEQSEAIPNRGACTDRRKFELAERAKTWTAAAEALEQLADDCIK